VGDLLGHWGVPLKGIEGPPGALSLSLSSAGDGTQGLSRARKVLSVTRPALPSVLLPGDERTVPILLCHTFCHCHRFKVLGSTDHGLEPAKL
jgi:hypothetical protein